MVVGGKAKHPRKAGKGKQKPGTQAPTPTHKLPKPVPEQKRRIELEDDDNDEEGDGGFGTRAVRLIVDERTGLMDDDTNHIELDGELLQSLRASTQMDFFDTAKFNNEMKDI